MEKAGPTVRLHLWLETGEGVFFGTGRVFLLRGIDKYGSLKKAAEAMGMSYRAAWGKIKVTEEILGLKLIEKQAGNRCGYRVTDQGRELVDKFDLWFKRVEADALKEAREIFNFTVHGYLDG